MDGVTLREPRPEDWPQILELAESTLADLPVIPSQREWLDNRRSFSTGGGLQRHFVATLDDRILGYASTEHHETAAEGTYRLFLVVPREARPTLGTHLLARLGEILNELGARSAWLLEYAADTAFLAYLNERGFSTLKTFDLADQTPVVQLGMAAPFRSLARTP